MDFITNNLKEIALAIIAVFAGIAVTISIRKKNKTISNQSVQKKNKVRGDMAGRDVNKNN